MANQVDPSGIAWDAPAGGVTWDSQPRATAVAPASGIQWDDDVQGPPRANFANVQADVGRTAMSPAQASGEVPLPSDWQGDRPAAQPAAPRNLRDMMGQADPFAQIVDSAPVQDFADNFSSSAFGKGAIARLHEANAFAGKLEAAPAIIWDQMKTSVTGVPSTDTQDAIFDRVAASERVADANRLDPKAGFLQKLAYGTGGLAVDLPMMAATGGESAVAPAIEAAAPTATRIVGSALEHSARASLAPGAVNATNTAQDVLNRGGTGQEAMRAAIGSGTADVLTNALPLSAEGGVLKRLMTGGAAGAAGAGAANDIRNATLPDDMQREPEAADAGLGAVQGGLMAAILGHGASPGPMEQLNAVRAQGDLGDRRATAADALARAGSGDVAATADGGRIAPAPIPAENLSNYAQTRLGELEGRNDLSAPETEERDFLRKYSTDPQMLADALGVELAQSGAQSPDRVTAAANEAATSPSNDLAEPTDAQRDAGNYRKGHVRVNGLDLSIENPRGSTRSGTDSDGNAWSVEMQHHYGYIKGSKSADGEHVDVFLGPEAESPDAPVFVVDQVDPKSGKFDEHKVMLGFPDAAAAEAGYRANYSKDWDGIGAITPTTLGDFKAWLADGSPKKPFAESAQGKEAARTALMQDAADAPKRTELRDAQRELAGYEARARALQEEIGGLDGERGRTLADLEQQDVESVGPELAATKAYRRIREKTAAQQLRDRRADLESQAADVADRLQRQRGEVERLAAAGDALSALRKTERAEQQERPLEAPIESEPPAAADGSEPNGDVRYSRPRTPVLGDDGVVAGWTALAQHDDAFRYPTSEAKSVPQIFRDIEPGFTAAQSVDLAEGNVEPADVAWRIRTPGGRDASVFQRGKEVWVDVSDLKQGEEGQRIYNAIANYAHNTGRVFIGDPAGLSAIALKRRTENMLSSALKFGTTDHLHPHDRQLQGDRRLGVPPLKWKVGDTAHNIREMARTTWATTLHEFPEIGDLTYNAKSGRFEREDGREVTDADFDRIAEEGRERVARSLSPASGGRSELLGPGEAASLRVAQTAGRTSLKRAVLTNSLLRGEGGAGGRELLARLGGEREGTSAGRSVQDPLARILYSKPAGEAEAAKTTDGAEHDGNDETELDRAGQAGSSRERSDAGAAAEESANRGTGRGLPRTDESGVRSEAVGRSTPETLRAELHGSGIGTALRVLENAGTLKIIDDPAQRFAGSWDGKVATLNAAHIPAGEGIGVALHELGIHRERDAGLRGMLGDDVFGGLVRRVSEIERSTAPVYAGAREVIAEARSRIEADTPAHLRDEELLAYTAEAAARRLSAGKPDSVVRDLLSRVVSRIRAWLATGPIGKALAARGFALKVTPDDLAQIAMAAVRRQARVADRGAGAEAPVVETRLSVPALNAGQQSALTKIGAAPKRETLRTAWDRITDRARERLTQGIVDQFAPLKDLDMTAYMQARLSKGTDGALEATFLHGTPKLTDGALDIDADGKGLQGVLSDLDGEHDLFLAWVAGNRASKLKAEGRERLFTDDDIAALKSLNQGTMANGRVRGIAYAKAQEAFQRYQKSVLDIAEEAGLIDGASRSTWESEFYVPFYRLADEDAADFVPSKVGSGLVKAQAFKKLKGGTEGLNDLLGNTLANWSNLLTGSMRNMAATKALAAAEKMGVAERIGAAEKGSVWISDKGQQVHYRVDDPLVLDALTALNFTGIKGAAMDAMRWFRHALTVGVTISPTFRIRNLLRDTISVLAVSDHAGYNPLRNIVDGWQGTKHGGETDIKLLAGGGKVRFGTLNDGQQARNAKRLIKMGVEDANVLDTQEKVGAALRKAWDWWHETGDRSETINRAAVYQNARKAGKSHLEASYEARDLLDFTMGGKWASVRFLTGVVPFLNARIQGLYKLGKGASGNPGRFAAVAGAVAMASTLAYLLQKDDDDYKALPDWARDSYWCIKLGDKMLYIPKPFEIGALGSIAERSAELALSGGDYRANDFAHTMANILSDQLSMNPVPQAVKPMLESWANYDTFQQRPIDSMGDERLPPRDRYSATTSAGAVAAGRALNLSPKKIEFLARGYFGWLGTQALNASDWMLRDAMGLPSNPRRDVKDLDTLMLVGDFVKNAQTNSDKYVTRFYNAQQQIDQAYAAYQNAKKTGDADREEDLADDPDVRRHKLYAGADRRMTKLNQRIKEVSNDRDLSAHEKRVQLDELYAERNALAKDVDERARAE